MKTTYTLQGMTCSGCEYKVKYLLEQVANVQSATANKDQQEVIIEHELPINFTDLQAKLTEKYNISEKINIKSAANNFVEDKKSWWRTYTPILLIFGYITGVTLLIQLYNNDTIDWMQWMQHFMAGFFLVFSFFKLLNLKGFAESYRMYDVVAKYIPVWAYIYAFLELALGLAYLTNFQPFATNLITSIVMSVSIIGVLQTVLNKKTIKCACLGAVFNLPMSTVTIIEDGLMILMSISMLMML